MYSSIKRKPAIRRYLGTAIFKDAPMLTRAIQPWQSHLGARTSLVLHQDDAVMCVNIFPTKLGAAAKQITKEGMPQIQKTGPGAESLAWAFMTGGARNQPYAQ